MAIKNTPDGIREKISLLDDELEYLKKRLPQLRGKADFEEKNEIAKIFSVIQEQGKGVDRIHNSIVLEEMLNRKVTARIAKKALLIKK